MGTLTRFHINRSIETVRVRSDDVATAVTACRELADIVQHRIDTIQLLDTGVDNSTALQYHAYLLLVANRLEWWTRESLAYDKETENGHGRSDQNTNT